jgi:uncharacterized protein (TIGR02271 family)
MPELEKTDATDEITIRRHEEVLEPTVRPVERGLLRVSRRVETIPSEVLADVAHDEVLVERFEIGQTVDSAPAPRQEGDTWIIPVIEEVLVVEKRLVVREEIHITRRRVTEQVPVSDTVRRQVIEMETESVTGERRPVDLRRDDM